MKQLNILDKIKKSKKYIASKIKTCPKVAIICGSGLSNIKNAIKQEITIPYSKIPYFKESTVEGHIGELVVGKLNHKDIFLLNGRVHYYEGYTMQEISYPIRVMESLGVQTLIITCAVGATNKKYNIGDIVIIKDHINFIFNNPLIGKHYNEFGARFPDMTNLYNQNIRKQVLQIAKKNKIKCYEGIYFAVRGPSYETPAEIFAYRSLGADVVGMSLVAESIVAKQMGMNILALTYISNKASGISKKILEHEEVLNSGKKATKSIEKIISVFLKEF
jgi:purine-nucleoside phosphorylase